MISFPYTSQEHTGLEVLHAEGQFCMQTQTTVTPGLRLLGVYLLLNKSLLISVCFVVICIFPTTEIWPRNKNAVYLTEMLLFQA